MKRIFIAVRISLEIRQKAEEWKASFIDLPVRWVPDENLHITLVPPWDEENVEEIINRLEKIQDKIIPFKVGFQRVAYGPNPYNPRLIWAEGEATEELEILQKEISKLVGRESPDRGSKPHLTLARFRSEDYRYFPTKKLPEKIDWTEEVGSVCLIESILKPEGVRYKILKTIKL